MTDYAAFFREANAKRLATFRANPDIIKGVKNIATFNSHTALICIAYSGAEWDLDGKPINDTKLPFNGGPPHHDKCNCTLVAITKTFRDLGLNIPEPAPSTRASDEGQIPATTTFDDFLKRKPPAYVDSILGLERAALWRSGVIRCHDLADERGQIVPIETLLLKSAGAGRNKRLEPVVSAGAQDVCVTPPIP